MCHGDKDEEEEEVDTEGSAAVCEAQREGVSADGGCRARHREAVEPARLIVTLAGRGGGRSASEVPLAVHGEWAPAKDRPDPISILEGQGKTRVQDLLPIRYGRMAESPFGFYRGAAAVMAADLAETATTKIPVQLSGDAHLVNFGGFATPERRLIFDVNDFDETLPGPWEWDLERLGASFAVAARAKRLDDKDGQNAVERVALSYADTLTHLASLPTLDGWYWGIDADVVEALMKTAGAKSERRVDKAIERAHAHDRLQAVAKLTESSTDTVASSINSRW